MIYFLLKNMVDFGNFANIAFANIKYNTREKRINNPGVNNNTTSWVPPARLGRKKTN